MLHSLRQSTLGLTIRDITISSLLRFDLVESIMPLFVGALAIYA